MSVYIIQLIRIAKDCDTYPNFFFLPVTSALYLRQGGSIVLVFEYRRANFFVETICKLSQEDVVQISWRFTVEMLTKQHACFSMY